MELTHDEVIEFPGFHNTAAIAHVRVFETAGKTPVVIVGELDDNPSTSITNAAEAVADVIQQRYFRDGREFEYFEYYPRALGEGTEPDYDRVEFDLQVPDERRTEHLGQVVDIASGTVHHGAALRGGFRRPNWRYVGKDAMEKIVGYELPEWPEPESYTTEAVRRAK